MRRPPTLLFAHRRCCSILGRQPLAVILGGSLPRLWGITEPLAYRRLKELETLGLVRHVVDHRGAACRIILTNRGARIAGVVPDDSGVNWIPAGGAGEPVSLVSPAVDYDEEDAEEQARIEAGAPDLRQSCSRQAKRCGGERSLDEEADMDSTPCCYVESGS